MRDTPALPWLLPKPVSPTLLLLLVAVAATRQPQPRPYGVSKRSNATARDSPIIRRNSVPMPG